MPFDVNPPPGAAGALATLVVALVIRLILRRREKNFQASVAWLAGLYGLTLSVQLFVSLTKKL